MARIELNVVALGDFASVNAQVKSLQTQVDLLNKSLVGVGLSSTLGKDLAAAQAAFKSTMLSTGQFTMQTVAMTSETEKFGQALVAGKLKLSDYFNIITKKSSEATTSLAALTAEQVKLSNSVVMTDPMRKGFLSVYTPTQINAVTDATKLATMQQDMYNLSLNASSKALITWGKNTQWAGRQLTVGLTMPMLMFGAAAVKSFKDTNTELTKLQRLYGEGLTPPSQAQLNQISGQVLNLGKQVAQDMGIAQTETVKVAANFAAMGREGQNLLDTTYQTQRLSKLGAVDASAATNTVVALQNVYKVSTGELANAVNFLSDIQKQTTMTLGDMTEAIPRVGPIMQQLGGTYKDTAVMLVAMREAGIPAAQAANAVKSAIASMIAPTSAASKEFAQYGINLTAIKDSTQGNPVKMIEALQAGMAKLSPLVKEQLIEKLFGKFQFARVSALLDNFGKIGSQTQNALKIAGATNQELATLANQEMKQATESATAKWQRAMEGFKATLYPVGQKFLEIGSLILGIANKIGHAFSSLPGPVKTVLGIFAGLTALAGPVIMLTGLLANFAGYLMKGFLNIKMLMGGGKSMKELLTPQIMASKNAAELFSTAISSDVNAVDLLDQAIQRLTVSLEGMAGAMSTGTADVALTNASAIAERNMTGRISQEEFSSLPMARPATMAYNKSPDKIRSATFQKSHVSEAQMISYEEAQLLALDENLTQGSKAIIDAAIRDVRLGITKVEDFTLMRLSNFVTDFTAAANQGLKPQNGGYLKSKIISEELNASVYSTNFAQLGSRGMVVNEQAAAKLTAALNQTVKDVLLFDEEFKGMDILTDVELTKAFQKSLTMLNQNMNLLDEESAKLLQGFNQLNAEKNILYGRIGASTMKGFDPYEYGGVQYPGGKAMGTYAPRNAMYAGGGDYQLTSLTAKSKEITASIEKVWQQAGLDVPRVYLSSIEQAFASELPAAQSAIDQAMAVSGEQAVVAFITPMQMKIESSMTNLARYIPEAITAETSLFADAGEMIAAGIITPMQARIEEGMTNIGRISAEAISLETSVFNAEGITLADAYTEGLTAGLLEAGIKASKIVKLDIEKIVTENLASMDTAGMTLAEAFNLAMQKALNEANIIVPTTKLEKLTGALSGKGATAGIGMAAMMGGSYVSGIGGGNNSTANAAGSALTAAGSISMLAMFVPQIMASLGPLMVVVGGLVFAFKAATDEFRTQENALKSSYTMSAAAASQFNISFKPLATYDFSKTTDGLDKHKKSVSDNMLAIDNLTQAYINSTSQMDKDAIKKLGAESYAAALADSQAKVASDMASGATKEQGIQDAIARLNAAGRPAQEIISIKNALLKTTGGLEGVINAVNAQASAYQPGFFATLLGHYTDFTKGAADAVIQLTQTTAKNVDTQFKSVQNNPTVMRSLNDPRMYQALADAMKSSIPGFDKYAATFKAKGGDTRTLAEAITMLNSGFFKDPTVITKAMTDGGLAVVKLWNSSLAGIEKLQQVQASGASPTPTPTPSPTGTPTPYKATPADVKALASIKELADKENQVLKAAKERLAQEQKITAEIKRQNDFQTSKLDLMNQQRIAQASGDYLQSALLGQQIGSLQYDYNTTTQQNILQAQIDKLQENADKFNNALQDLKDAIANAAAGIKQIQYPQSVLDLGVTPQSPDVNVNPDTSLGVLPTPPPTPSPTPATTSGTSSSSTGVDSGSGTTWTAANGGQAVPGTGTYLGSQFIPVQYVAPGTYPVTPTTSATSDASKTRSIVATHLIKAGETLAGIASMYKLPFASLQAVNPVFFTNPKYNNGKTLFAGGTVQIPSFHTGGVVPGEHGKEVLSMLQAGELVVPAAKSDKIDNMIKNIETISGGDNYQIIVNAGSNASADDIAKTVMDAIKRKSDMISSNRKVVTN